MPVDARSLNEAFRLQGHEHLAFVQDYLVPTLLCRRCDARVGLEQVLYLPAARMVDHIHALIEEHRHPAPKPLTRDEREQMRTLLIHRRGALKFM